MTDSAVVLRQPISAACLAALPSPTHSAGTATSVSQAGSNNPFAAGRTSAVELAELCRRVKRMGFVGYRSVVCGRVAGGAGCRADRIHGLPEPSGELHSNGLQQPSQSRAAAERIGNRFAARRASGCTELDSDVRQSRPRARRPRSHRLLHRRSHKDRAACSRNPASPSAWNSSTAGSIILGIKAIIPLSVSR